MNETTAIVAAFCIYWLVNLLVLAWRTRHIPRQTIASDPRGGWTVAGLAISAAAGAYGANQQRKAAKASARAGQQAQVDPQEIARIAREQARLNVADSLALEGQYAPEQQAFRNESMRALLQQLRSGTPYSDLSLSVVADDLQAPDQQAQRSQLLADAINQTSRELALGGQLDTSTRNEVTRRAAATAGRTGGGRLGLGRTISARDLGLSSYQIGQDRLSRATQVGQIEQGLNQQDIINALNQRSQRAQLAGQLQGMEGNAAQRYLSLASFGQTLQAPESGLSPGDLASLYVQNASNAATAGQNAAALRAQTARNNAQLYGQIGGAIGALGSTYGRSSTTNNNQVYEGGTLPTYYIN